MEDNDGQWAASTHRLSACDLYSSTSNAQRFCPFCSAIVLALWQTIGLFSVVFHVVFHRNNDNRLQKQKNAWT